MSASMRPTRCPRAASATAMFTATVDFPTPPFPELTAITRPSPGISPGRGAGVWPGDPAGRRGGVLAGGLRLGGGRAVRGPGRARRVHHRDLDPVGLDAFYRLDGAPRLPHQRGRVVAGEQEREGNPPLGRHREIADHARGEEIVVEPGVPDAAKGRGDPGFEGRGHEVKSTPPASLPAPAAGGAPRSPGGA